MLASLIVSLIASLVPAAGLAAIQQPAAPPGQAKKVRIVVATQKDHQAACAAKKYETVDILVLAVKDPKEGLKKDPTQDLPRSCVNGQVIDHKTAHEKYGEVTVVQLSYKAKESVTWYSEATEFLIAKIAPHNDPDAKSAPPNPFVDIKFPTATSRSINSGPILQAAIDHRYKITLRIGKRYIDPDIWCGK